MKKNRNPNLLPCRGIVSFLGTVLKKAKPLNKLRPDEAGTPFAVRVLAFLITSLTTQGAIVSFHQSVEKRLETANSGSICIFLIAL